jgi:hypothetical protein
MEWFANKGQIAQLAAQIIIGVATIGFAGQKAWTDMKDNQYLTAGALLFYALVAIVALSVVFSAMRVVRAASVPKVTLPTKQPSEQVSEIRLLKDRIKELSKENRRVSGLYEQQNNAAIARDAIINARDATIAELREQIELLREQANLSLAPRPFLESVNENGEIKMMVTADRDVCSFRVATLDTATHSLYADAINVRRQAPSEIRFRYRRKALRSDGSIDESEYVGVEEVFSNYAAEMTYEVPLDCSWTDCGSNTYAVRWYVECHRIDMHFKKPYTLRQDPATFRRVLGGDGSRS